MSEDKRTFVARRLDEVIHEWEADAPPGSGTGQADGPLVTAQRHRAEVDTATDERVDEIAASYPDIAAAWSSHRH
ncbi:MULTISPECIES: hypothetical protein [Rhodococcus]|jgi:hypothetical protein|uniref:Uncharacterized protein n=1 Tax=Rhodococcus oxybenzonivorans TaxID=1990687 RepID=A0AAE4V182_9NOCA|nr:MULTISPECIES: hypothetical protein [Rhodococcus]MDV7242326.1 hypothetical protein [Rhodococcus oxybenzonivorans]MDV7266635.1 hypothetical protein [Rhodococcus oxybenzonivorans]MDV7277073.1 hypothetical protein [Rhodococcus oxybenzonivorans]MDV7331815.1 hypothetical protein [Rhodococcus oxybenzonivorans]MDV7344036.1 hypothetical protein [Rhodococcus oxybenzonivorans]